MSWHHKVPFEQVTEESETERQLRQLVAELRREKIRLEDRVAELEAEVRQLHEAPKSRRRR